MSPRINYRKKEKIISFRFSAKKSVDSDIHKNIVIDYDKDGKVVGIDLMEVNLENFVPVRKFASFAIKKK
ncbi:MAG: DUF2283 domain-containing protein [Candidatus Moraniibacteriota bacterium]